MALLALVHALFQVSICYNLDVSHTIMYQAPDEAHKDSYFGLSVAIRPRAAAINGSWIIQIGAPRGGGEGSPGTVYRCQSYGACKMLPVDREASAFGGQDIYEFREKKDGAWIGVSMDMMDSGAYERSVVCGHRWMNDQLKNEENIDVTYMMTGVCYLQDLFNETFEAPVQRLLPLLNKDKIYSPKPYVVDLSTYHWGLGQAGLSVRLTGSSGEMVIGAPGVTHWIGSVVRYDKILDVVVGRFASSEIVGKSRYTYLGYAVSSGRFYKDGELWYVAGAPRSANYRGKVYIFQFKGSSEDVRLRSHFEGATFGEYFGASLATTDLDNDGFDDLIVGAPLFASKNPDEGRIYVFLGTGRGNFLLPSLVINGYAGEGRFGSCVTAVGDLDRDGYKDLAVGAPYEEQRGAVYIYRGFSGGLKAEYSQRISARDIQPYLRGFGVSISPGVDVDGNKYPDIAVGAYLSGHVVLMRTRPVIVLHPRIQIDDVSPIDRRASHLNVTVCSRYAGHDATGFVDIIRTVEIESAYGKAVLDTKTSAYKKVIRLQRSQITCELLSVLLNTSETNYSPLKIALRNEIRPCTDVEEETKDKNTFPKMCPMGNQAEISKEIPFAGVCGADLVCRSDLQMSCALPSVPGGSYVLGSTDPIVLSIEIKNQGEPAYNTRIIFRSDLKLRHYEPRHEGPPEPSENTFKLDLETVLAAGRQTKILLQIDLDALNGINHSGRVHLWGEVLTSSLETNEKDNHCRLSLELVSHAHLDFHASSSLTSVYLTEKVILQQRLNVTHYYEVRKTGVTPLRDAQLTIYIPFYYKEHFISFEAEASEWMHSEVSDSPEEVAFEGDRSSVPDEAQTLPTNRTFFVNCSTPGVGCKILRIFFEQGIPAGLSSFVKILLSFNMSALDSGNNDKDILHLSTVGVINSSEFLEKKPTVLRRSASVSLYRQQGEPHVGGHVIGVSILAGGFLLSLIVTGLMKTNFFRRVKKEELEALKETDACFICPASPRKEADTPRDPAESF